MTSRSRSRELERFRVAAALLGALLVGCSASTTTNLGMSGAQSSGGSDNGGANAGGGAAGLIVQPPDDNPTCKPAYAGDLRCKKVACPSDKSPSTTSISGTVYDPAGRVPLYNVVVYVPNEELKPLGDKVACETCSEHFKSKAAAVGLTDANGHFRVTDMPAGENIPLVIQIGKWRRQVTLPPIEPCVDTEITDRELTRLPRNQAEGNLPRIAVATGGSDALECLIRRIGIDEAEFTPDSGSGRVHLFSGFRAAKEMMSNGATVPLTRAETLWSNVDAMLPYDMMLMGCEGSDNLWNRPDGNGDPLRSDEVAEGAIPRTLEMHQAVRAYADQGGRIFGSHWHHRWINSDGVTPEDPYPEVAQFASSAQDIGEVSVSVDVGFPKGAAFAQWLLNVNASERLGELPVVKAEHSVDAVNNPLAQRWIFGQDPKNATPMVQYFSFTTPVADAVECGRMVFSDVHVLFGGGDYSNVAFPARCDADPSSELSPQEKALEFMLFDLSSCIQKEDDEIQTPIVVVK